MARPVIRKRRPLTPEEKAGMPPPKIIQMQPQETNTYAPVSPPETGLARKPKKKKNFPIEGAWVLGNKDLGPV